MAIKKKTMFYRIISCDASGFSVHVTNTEGKERTYALYGRVVGQNFAFKTVCLSELDGKKIVEAGRPIKSSSIEGKVSCPSKRFEGSCKHLKFFLMKEFKVKNYDLKLFQEVWTKDDWLALWNSHSIALKKTGNRRKRGVPSSPESPLDRRSAPPVGAEVGGSSVSKGKLVLYNKKRKVKNGKSNPSKAFGFSFAPNNPGANGPRLDEKFDFL